MSAPPRLIAFYLPQFHPIPENDLWWGKGFTEWTNVTKAQPLFEDHYQPHLPTDFGFYDLRLRETRREQIRVAKEYGIDGFCYHFYWFSGRRILEKPLEDMLSDPASDMPFCLCWANENWTRRWDAADHEILLEQRYLPNDDHEFIQSVEPYLRDPRYIKIDGKPLLIVYRAQELPDARRSAARWREYCRAAGLGDIHLCAALTHGNEDYGQFGFDSGVEFPPHNIRQKNINEELSFFEAFKGNVLQFATVARAFLERGYAGARVFKTVFPSWDNTARTSGRATLMLNGTPENYEYWLSETISLTRKAGQGETLVFINAWNEWAEGCHLEPDRRYGRAFLEATRNAKDGLRRFSDFTHKALPAASIAAPRRFWPEQKALLSYHLWRYFGSIKLAINRRPWLRNLLLPLVRGLRKLMRKA
ncbi:MAG: glycoside hydrolase family 99-like domain-containing protein [Pseudomonadales bacterium]|jgi:lipopolysaccharide biosynthesis protein|nr:glycoside hydrolase family 99-like domain-containing protein [Pseudomonadales bacterium]